MRMRTLLPLIGLLALGACQDEKKANATNQTSPPAATNTAPPTTPPPGPNAAAPGTPTNPAPANKPAGQ
ncbi:MAG TPA: hypothetical protein VGO18_24795 [Steroidobacteraceae bacterium]|jgi:hypothetical protein|nr:hypothetical protein [Steroidobacteraceae bacterium]